MLPAGGNPIYYVEDMLGTSRLITTNNGTVCYDADFDPFGGEHPYTNTCPQNYKFESKERDTETGNDDFGARYYTSRFGRWLSADWSNVPVPVPYANLTNPQTLNLYAMVSDDPESFADLDGHIQNASQGLSAESGGINPGTGELTADGLSCESHPESCESAAEQQQQAQNQISAPRAVQGTLTINTISTGDHSSTDGHAWIAFTPDGGATTTYGTYGNSNGAQGVQGVNVNSETNLTPTTSRSAHISADQAAALSGYVAAQIKLGSRAWTYTAPCSSFASGAWQAGTGEKISPSYGGVLSTPTNLGHGITNANGGQPTGVVVPLTPRAPPPVHSSSFP